MLSRLQAHALALALVVALSGPAAACAQISLPILADPTFKTLSGESAVGSQLSSWGVKIGPIDVKLDLGLLALPNHSSDLLGRRSMAPTSSSRRAAPGDKRNRRDLEILVTLDGEVEGERGWGEADNVARGERGDTEWFTYISIGSPPQSLPILPDTGSSDTFVFAPDCTTCHLNNHSSFAPSASSSFTPVDGTFQVKYADGSSASGRLGRDVFAFGQAETVHAAMPFGLATASNGSSFRNSARSGILGLGLEGMATIPNGTTLFAALVHAGMITEKVLSIRVEKGVQSDGVVTKEGTGAYVFGGIEGSYIRGGRLGLQWIDTTSANYWGFPLEDISMGLTSTLLGDSTTPRRAIIDTGTSLIITSDIAAANIHRHVPGSSQAKSGVWYIPCAVSWPTVPNLFFTINGIRYGVPVADLAWKASAVYPDLCISGVQGGMPHFTVLGDMFIKNHYVVLSYEGDIPQVGLGERTDVPVIL